MSTRQLIKSIASGLMACFLLLSGSSALKADGGISEVLDSSQKAVEAKEIGAQGKTLQARKLFFKALGSCLSHRLPTCLESFT